MLEGGVRLVRVQSPDCCGSVVVVVVLAGVVIPTLSEAVAVTGEGISA